MKVLFTGSFDPVTTGHLSLITRAASLFDEVVCTVFNNAEKTHFLSAEQRLLLLRAAVAHLPNVTCDLSCGYVADYAKKNGIHAIIRGIRNGSDLAYEREMADYNKRRSGVETILLPAESGMEEVSSSLLRRLISEGRSTEGLLPDAARAVLADLGISSSAAVKEKI